MNNKVILLINGTEYHNIHIGLQVKKTVPGKSQVGLRSELQQIIALFISPLLV